MSNNKTEIVANDEDEENETEVFSLQDVIEGSEVASAVLAASDPTNCSYNEGYVYRQALYCCITCLKENLKVENSDIENKETAYLDMDESYLHAICLGCTYECHQNHELIELYTKRNFKCDCGNSKFKTNNACKLQPNKDAVNHLNKYNHNFKGLYCSCNRPYPEVAVDSELNNSSTEENSEEMVQCTICEDWFHTNHLLGNEKFQNDEEFEDMICHSCMEENKYLWYYQGYIAIKIQTDTNEKTDETIDITGGTSEQKIEEIHECLLKKYQSKFKDMNLEQTNQACCFLSGWRVALCKCNECLELYKSKKVDFLINPNDTIKYYEERGKQNEAIRTNDENKLLDDQLSKLNRVSQIEFLHNVKDFKEDLTTFLTSFAQNGQVVKRENVMQFFEELNERKKRKLEDNKSISSYFCK